MSRPWTVSEDNWERCVEDLFQVWLYERGGIVVYQNQMFDSSAFGDKSFCPARVYAEGSDELQDAPERLGDLPSQRQQKVDHIKLLDFEGGFLECIEECFVKEEDEDAEEG